MTVSAKAPCLSKRAATDPPAIHSTKMFKVVSSCIVVKSH